METIFTILLAIVGVLALAIMFNVILKNSNLFGITNIKVLGILKIAFIILFVIILIYSLWRYSAHL